MAGEQPASALDTSETRGESSIGVAKATTPHAEDVVVNPAEGSDNDSEDIDIEEDSNIIRPTKPSHVDFGKFTIKGGHIEVLTKFH